MFGATPISRLSDAYGGPVSIPESGKRFTFMATKGNLVSEALKLKMTDDLTRDHSRSLAFFFLSFAVRFEKKADNNLQ